MVTLQGLQLAPGRHLLSVHLVDFVILLEDNFRHGLVVALLQVSSGALESLLMVIFELLYLHELLADFTVLAQDHGVHLFLGLLLLARMLSQYVHYLNVLLHVGRLELLHLLADIYHLVQVVLLEVSELAADLRNGLPERANLLAVVRSEPLVFFGLNLQLILLLLVGCLKAFIFQLQIGVLDG